jgi:hypothetical protein
VSRTVEVESRTVEVDGVDSAHARAIVPPAAGSEEPAAAASHFRTRRQTTGTELSRLPAAERAGTAVAPQHAAAPAPVADAATAAARGEALPSPLPAAASAARPEGATPPPREPAAEAAAVPGDHVFPGADRAQLSSALLRRTPAAHARTAVPRPARPAAPAAPAAPTGEAPVPARSPAPTRPSAEARPPAAVAHAAALDTDELLDELSERLALAAAELGVEA